MSEPAGMLPSMFEDNSALYGSMWATETAHFQVNSSSVSGNSAKSTVADNFEVTTYQESYDMSVFARDFYGQLVLSNSHSLVKIDLGSADMQHCGSRQPSVTGVSLLQMLEGVSLFEGTFVSCMPGGNMTLVFKDADSDSLLNSNDIVLKFRKCFVGEYYRKLTVYFCYE